MSASVDWLVIFFGFHFTFKETERCHVRLMQLFGNAGVIAIVVLNPLI